MSFLSRLGNLVNPISQIRGLAQGTNALLHGDLRNAARGMSGVTTGISMSQRGRGGAPIPKTGPAGGGPLTLEQGDKGFGMQPMMPPQQMPMGDGMNKAAGMSFIQGGGPTGQPMMPNMGADIQNARRQFQLDQLQRNPIGGSRPGGY